MKTIKSAFKWQRKCAAPTGETNASARVCMYVCVRVWDRAPWTTWMHCKALLAKAQRNITWLRANKSFNTNAQKVNYQKIRQSKQINCKQEMLRARVVPPSYLSIGGAANNISNILNKLSYSEQWTYLFGRWETGRRCRVTGDSLNVLFVLIMVIEVSPNGY